MYLDRQCQTTEDLNQWIELAKQQEISCCFALIVLDCVPYLHEFYDRRAVGHVLKDLEDYLRPNFRSIDVLVRLGHEELVLGIYDISIETAVRRVCTSLQIFNQRSCLGDGLHLFPISFSSVVVECPQDGADMQALYDKARKMLHR